MSEQKIYLCPVCGRDQLQPVPRELRARLRGIQEEMNPGGRVLIWPDGRKLQLSDCCGPCDHDAIRKFLDATEYTR